MAAVVVAVIVPAVLPERAGVVVVVTMETFAAVTAATACHVSDVGQALCLALRTCSLVHTIALGPPLLSARFHR